MLTIGLTGGVGSGKTTVTRHFSMLGVPVIDADELARDLVKIGEPAYNKILEVFGRDVLTPEKEIDRRKLRKVIFNNSQSRVMLESILHPLVRQGIQKQIGQINASYCIVAIPLLIETGQTDIVDRILVVSAPKQAQIQRTVARDGVNESDVEAILAAQVGNELRLSMADDVLENDGDLDSIYPKVKSLHEKYLKMAGVEIPEETESFDQNVTIADSVKKEQVIEPEMPVLDNNTVQQQAGPDAVAGEQRVFELPLNEKMRTLIRLEFLFSEIEHYLQGDTVWDIRSAVNSFIATLNVLCRPELKTDLMKEMDRINVSLTKYDRNDQVNSGALASIRSELSQKSRYLKGMEGQLGQHLKQNELVTALRQRESIPGGALAMDMPAYAHWLGRSFDACKQDIHDWLSEFKLVKDSVELILSLIRGSAVATNAIAKAGFYQHTLDTDLQNQMVRVVLPQGVNYFPEISGGKHRFTVRFLKPCGTDRPVQSEEEIHFKLVCCAL